MALTYKDYLLDETAVEAISADVQRSLNEKGIDQRNAQRIRLTAEELLLNIMGSRGREVPIRVGMGRQFGRQMLRLRYDGASFDPTKSSDNPWADDMMRSLGFYPAWSYRGGVNTVSLVLADRPKPGAALLVILALLAAVALGAIGSYCFPEALRQTLSDAILDPLANGFLGLLNTFAGVMIALTVCSGMLGMGDSATAGRIGRSFVFRLIGISFAISIATVAILLPFLRLNFAAGAPGQPSQMGQIGQLVFAVLPTNIVEPFQTGNALQIIVIALLVGGALLAIGERGGRIRSLVGEAATLAQRVVGMVCALVPLFVFVMLLRQIWSGDAGTLLAILKPILVTVAVVLIVTAVVWLIAAARLKCPPILLLKKVLPVFLIAFTTASSMAALPLGMEICEKKLGVKNSAVSFVYPLGSVMYMPASVVYFTALACACAEIYQVEIRPSWLVMAIVVATLLTIALPPVPGAGMLGFTVLFSSLGIPVDALVIATTTDILFEFYDTGFNVMMLAFRVACEAKRNDGLDREILLK